MERLALTRNIRAAIINHALPAGGWASGNGKSPSVETTCLALMALRDAQGPVYEKGRRLLEHAQNPDGSWPAFIGDDLQGCWTTSLAFIALHAIQTKRDAVEKALPWLLRDQGREGHWLWNLKFRFAARKVRFNPDKFGWSWFPGTVSWVIPTAFAMIALQQAFSSCQSEPVSKRIQLGKRCSSTAHALAVAGMLETVWCSDHPSDLTWMQPRLHSLRWQAIRHMRRSQTA